MKRTAKRTANWLARHVARVWQRRKQQLAPTLMAAALLFAAAIFVVLADKVTEGATLKWDESVLTALRRADDPRVPVGPAWLREAGLDITALGSPLILTFFIAASIGLLYFEGQHRVAGITAVTAGGGALLSLILKGVFGRPRPSVVPHLRDVLDTSFPSGHSMGAAVVYLTVGMMFMKSFKSRRAKAFCMFWAVLLTILVGASRVYLGVHYPSDVAGGWLAGLGWACACWSAAVFVPNRPLPEVSDVPRSKAAA